MYAKTIATIDKIWIAPAIINWSLIVGRAARPDAVNNSTKQAIPVPNEICPSSPIKRLPTIAVAIGNCDERLLDVARDAIR